MAQSNNDGVTGEQASWINSSSSAVTVKIRVERFDPTRTAYRLGVGY